ncbi:MAG: hypothetical protein GF333_08215 [Candidatus Omnitrophica bacterium]|nr:hypothetical protein [Candidatus Omnitrophota bacterium]
MLITYSGRIRYNRKGACMKEKSASERRKHSRAKVDFTLTYAFQRPFLIQIVMGKREFEAEMVDLSEGGLALLTQERLSDEDRLKIKFTLVNPTVTSMEDRMLEMNITGKIVYQKKAGGGNYRIGIAFEDIASQDKKAICNYVETVLSE